MLLREQKEDGMEESYDGPYTIISFEPKAKAYRVIDHEGSLVRRRLSSDKMKIIASK